MCCNSRSALASRTSRSCNTNKSRITGSMGLRYGAGAAACEDFLGVFCQKIEFDVQPVADLPVLEGRHFPRMRNDPDIETASLDPAYGQADPVECDASLRHDIPLHPIGNLHLELEIGPLLFPFRHHGGPV